MDHEKMYLIRPFHFVVHRWKFENRTRVELWLVNLSRQWVRKIVDCTNINALLNNWYLIEHHNGTFSISLQKPTSQKSRFWKCSCLVGTHVGPQQPQYFRWNVTKDLNSDRLMNFIFHFDQYEQHEFEYPFGFKNKLVQVIYTKQANEILTQTVMLFTNKWIPIPDLQRIVASYI